MVVNSLITSHADGAKVKAGKVTVSGLAWDGGYGIRRSKSRPTAARPGRRPRLATGSWPLRVPAVELHLDAKKG